MEKIGAHIVRQLKAGDWAVCAFDENNIIARHKDQSTAVADAESRRIAMPSRIHSKNVISLARPTKTAAQPASRDLVKFCHSATFRLSNGSSCAIELGKCATPSILLRRISEARTISGMKLQILCADGNWLYPNHRAANVMADQCTIVNIDAIFSEAVLWVRHCNELDRIVSYVAEEEPNDQSPYR